MNRNTSRSRPPRVAMIGVAGALLCACAAAQETPFASPSRDFDFLHMKLDVALSHASIAAGRMHAVVTHKVRPRRIVGMRKPPAPPTRLRLDAVDLDIQTVELGPPWRAAEYKNDGEHLTIELDAAARDAKEFSVRIAYVAERPKLGLHFVRPKGANADRRTAVYTHAEPFQARYWLPCHDWPDTRWPSDVSITVPTPFSAVSVGVPLNDGGTSADPPAIEGLEVAADEAFRRFDWRIKIPIDPHLFGLAVGEYVELTIDDGLGGPPVLAYVQSDLEAKARYTFRNVPRMIRYYAELTGVDYPFPQYSHVAVPSHFHGGMEHAGFSMLAPRLFSLAAEGAARDRRVQYNYISHMLAHEWFGGLVNYQNITQAWLNEGFATYLHQLWRSQAESSDAFDEAMWSTAQRITRIDRVGSGRPIINTKLRTPNAVYGFDGGKIYWKGAWVLHMLRHELGDETFFKAVRTYLTQNRTTSVETTHLREAFEEVSGRDLIWFFDQWVLRGGTPELEVKYRWDAERGRALVTVEQTQEIDAEYPPFQFSLDLYFKVAGKVLTERVRVREPTHEFEIALDAQPEVFCVDPGGRVLKSLELSKPAALWIAQIRGGPTALSRTQAILRVRSKEEEVAAAGDALTAALCDAAEYSGVRRRAASALQRLNPPGALDAFLAAERLANDDPRLLTGILRALGRHPDSPRAHAVVLRRAADSQPGDVRTTALTALCRFEATVCTDETFTTLGAALRGAAARRRETVLKAFERWKDVRTLEPLIEATPPDTGVRASELRRRLRLIADLGASGSAARPRAAYHLLAFVENPKATVRRTAVEGLGKIGGEFHITALTALTEQDQDEAVCKAARAAIEAIQERLDNGP